MGSSEDDLFMTMLKDCLANIAAISSSFSPLYISVSLPCDRELLPSFLFSPFFYPIFYFLHILVLPLHYSSHTLLKIHARSCLSFIPLSTSSLSHWCFLFQLLIALTQFPLRAISAVMLQHPKLTQGDCNVISVRAHWATTWSEMNPVEGAG